MPRHSAEVTNGGMATNLMPDLSVAISACNTIEGWVLSVHAQRVIALSCVCLCIHGDVTIIF